MSDEKKEMSEECKASIEFGQRQIDALSGLWRKIDVLDANTVSAFYEEKYNCKADEGPQPENNNLLADDEELDERTLRFTLKTLRIKLSLLQENYENESDNPDGANGDDVVSVHKEGETTDDTTPMDEDSER